MRCAYSVCYTAGHDLPFFVLGTVTDLKAVGPLQVDCCRLRQSVNFPAGQDAVLGETAESGQKRTVIERGGAWQVSVKYISLCMAMILILTI
jgi:hypothetical protein